MTAIYPYVRQQIPRKRQGIEHDLPRDVRGWRLTLTEADVDMTSEHASTDVRRRLAHLQGEIKYTMRAWTWA